MRFFCALATGLMAAAMVPASASAAVVTQSFDFQATGFSGSAVPGNLFTGSFTVTYDDAVATSDALVTAFSSNLTFGSPVLFTYIPDAQRLILGANGSAGANSQFTDDFTLVLYANASGLLPFPGGFLTPRALVSRPDAAGISITENVQFAAPGQLPPLQVTAVPEPSTWALMLIGFGGMGLAMRRRRVRAAPAPFVA